MITDKHGQVVRVLRLARQYIAKANEMGAYAGCTMSGERVLERLDAALDTLEPSPEFNALAVEDLEY